MKKVLSLIAVLCMALVCFVGCDLLSQFTPETPCEHDWVDATCSTPKTCSVCGETEGEANGHTEETVAGTPATCTEAGKTDGKKCSVCGETIVEQTAIAALGHTEETVAGTSATCTEAGMTEGKKCTVCGETTVEQTAIDALGHAPEADDGDVTTPVKCVNEGCDEILVAAKEAISLTIPAFENGAVVADKMNYAIGDTVKLAINPEWGYAQKLYVDGEALILDWNNNVYSFVAEKDSYEISGSFELSLDVAPKDPTRWETGNHAHGIMTTYYPANGDSWWMYINGNYSSITIKAKNYLPVEESMDGNGQDGYQQLLSMVINEKLYAFRIYNDKGTYAVSCTAVSGSVTGWGNWHAIDADAAAAMNGDGVDFKLERVGNSLVVSVNEKVYITYAMDGVTVNDQVASVGMQNNRNSGKYVDIPFALTVPAPVDPETPVDPQPPVEEGDVKITISELANGTVTSDKASYNVGDTVTLTVTPAQDYAQKLYINGEALLVDTNSKYSFVVEEGKTYEITGEFVYVKGDWFWTADYGMLNQAHGYIHAPAVSEKNGELVPTKDKCTGGKVLLTDPSGGTKADYGVTLKMAFSNGESTAIRLVAKDSNGNYFIQAMGGILGPQWKWYYDLSEAENAAIRNGEGVWFGLALEGNTLKVTVNGVVRNRADITPTLAEGVTIEQFKVQTFNFGYAVDLKCEFHKIDTKSPVTIDKFENGWVTADKASYNVGDTVTLTVTPAQDYAQKLYINGEALLVDTNSKYSFVVEEGKTYEITGEFVYVKGDWFWTADYGMLNQAHGYIHAPAVSEKNGELVPTKDKCTGGKVLLTDPSGGTKADYGVTLKMAFSNGESTAIRLVAKDSNGNYFIQAMGGILGPQWKWYYDLSEAENAAIRNGEGVWFGLALEGNTLKVTVNGVVRNRADITPTLAEGVTIEQFKVQTYNFSYAVDLKCEFYMYE